MTASAVAQFTYDADLALDPDLLGDSPALVDAMGLAGFQLSDQPGLYRRDRWSADRLAGAAGCRRAWPQGRPAWRPWEQGGYESSWTRGRSCQP